MASRRRDSSISRYIVLGIITFVALAVVLVLVLSNRAPVEQVENPGPDLSIPRGITEDGLPFLGDQDAPVTMLIYEDLGCPNCQRFFEDVEPEVLENFVVTGDVRLVVYTISFVNQLSLPGAEAATCALDQDKFWEFRDLLFTNQNASSFERANFVAWAEQLGMDRGQFANCFDTAFHAQDIISRSQTAFEFGITATPTIEISGERNVGVPPYDSDDPALPGIKQILEEALSEVSE